MKEALINVVVLELGSVYVTRKAADTIERDDAFRALGRHMAGDWGNVAYRDWSANDDALELGGGILSAYRDRHRNKFWIATEADRSVTTIMLPEEY